jgi:hypothetical protein
MFNYRYQFGRTADRRESDLAASRARVSSGSASFERELFETRSKGFENKESKRNEPRNAETSDAVRSIARHVRVVFFGDREDPYARAIAGAIPNLDRAWDCRDLIPDLGRFARELDGDHVIVAHRSNPRPIEIDRLAAVRTVDPAARHKIILCSGDYLRYREWNRSRTKFDAILAETSARETIALYVNADSARRSAPRERSPVAILGGNHAIRRTIAEACRDFGRDPAIAVDDDNLSNIQESTLIWIDPTFERNRIDLFFRAAERNAIVALIGCADRVRDLEARRLGASACLDFPCDLADLAFVLDRIDLKREIASKSTRRSV